MSSKPKKVARKPAKKATKKATSKKLTGSNKPWNPPPNAKIYWHNKTVAIRIFRRTDAWNSNPMKWIWEASDTRTIDSGVGKINGVADSLKDAVKRANEWANKIWGEKK